MASERHVREGLFRAGDDGPKLLGGLCEDCAQAHFPRGEVCPFCSSESCRPTELGPRGTLWLFTSVLRPPPGYSGPVPFGFGIVDLDQGARVVGRLTESDVGKLRRGQAMRLVIEPLHVDDGGEQVVTYAFAPEVDA